MKVRQWIRILASGVGVVVLAIIVWARHVNLENPPTREFSPVWPVSVHPESLKRIQEDRLPMNAAATQTRDASVAKKIQILDQILKARNDNDPRLDTEFKNLSTDAKAALIERYHSLPLEARNERGTIVFLVGREFASAQDAEFLRGVVDESPCLGLRDCRARDEATVASDHGTEADALTRNYPQWVVLQMLERARSEGRFENLDANTRAQLQRSIESLSTRKDVDSKLSRKAAAFLRDPGES